MMKLAQSDKNQISISEEPLVNVTTVTPLPQEPTPPLSLVSNTKSSENFNPTPVPLQPLQCAMCGQPKSSHPSRCPNYGVTCSACGFVGHNLIFCRKVIALKKSTFNPTRGNNNKRKKDHNNKKRRKSEGTSSWKRKSSLKNPKRLIWPPTSDAHVYMSRINPNSPDLSEDSDPPSSPLAQPSEEVPTLPPVLPDVPFVPYVHVPPPSLNPPPQF